MPDSSGYGSHLSADAVASILSLPARKQRTVLDIAERLAEHPFQISDYQTHDAARRVIENILVGEFLFSYWIDHAAREVRITEIIAV